jgi:hypothetical protein
MLRTALATTRGASAHLRRFSTKPKTDAKTTDRVLDEVGKTLTAWNKMQPATEGFVKTKSFTEATSAVAKMILWGAASGCGIYSTYRFWNQCDACARREYYQTKALQETQHDYNALKKVCDAEAASA